MMKATAEDFSRDVPSRDLPSRVRSARRYARALCNVVGSGGVYSHEQVYWLESIFVSKAFPSSIVDSAERMVKVAASKPDEVLVREIQGDLEKGRASGHVKVQLVQDMLRAATINDLPLEQCRVILAVAKNMGVEKESLLRIADVVDTEQLMIGSGFGSATLLVTEA